MYSPDEHGHDPVSGTSTGVKIALGVLIGILLCLAIGLVGAVGYYWGYRSAENQNTSAKPATPSPVPSVSPTPAPSPTPTPTPELAGKYTGPTGEVDISDVTEKGFTFGIGVGNENGSGSVDGKAVWTTPTVGIFSKIPDQALYDDPESSYYKKKCKLTFRFTGGKLKVSEDDYACSYFHGAQVDFEGTFARAKKK